MNVIKLSDLDVSGKRVFIRADLNVPQDEAGNITEDTRIRASLPSIKYCLEKGAAVMVTSHLGRPTEGQLNHEDSLTPVAVRLGQMLHTSVRLITDWVDARTSRSSRAKSSCSRTAASTRARRRTTTNWRRRWPSCATSTSMTPSVPPTAPKPPPTASPSTPRWPVSGMLMGAEIDALSKALHNPKRPLVAIVGGSKVSSKLTILKSLADKVDQLIVGGGIANTFLLADGKRIGQSLAEPDLVKEAHAIMDIMKERGAEVPLPTDVVVADEVSALARANKIPVEEVHANDRILDVGPKTAAKLAEIIANAGTVVWNGPVGVFELPQFAGGTKMMASAIAHSEAFSIAGGGDTLAAIAKFHIADDVGYISTGGGAFLEFLEGKTLPAIAILEERAAK